MTTFDIELLKSPVIKNKIIDWRKIEKYFKYGFLKFAFLF